MKVKHLLTVCLTCAASWGFVSCESSDSPTPDPEPPYDISTPYDNAEVKAPITMTTKLRQDNLYKVIPLTLDEAKIKAAFGGTMPKDLVLYGHKNAERDIYGSRWFTSPNGFCVNATGFVCASGGDDARLFAEYYPAGTNGYTVPTLGIGQLPEKCKAGDKFTFEVGLATTSVKVPLKVSVEISAAGDWAKSVEHADGLTYTVYETLDTSYKVLEVMMNEAKICAALGVENMAAFITEMKTSDKPFDTHFRGMNADNSYFNGERFTANNGYWFDADGNVCAWSKTEGTCSVFAEWDQTTPMKFRVGQFIQGVTVGDKFTIRMALVNGNKTAVITFKVHIVEEVTDDLGADE